VRSHLSDDGGKYALTATVNVEGEPNEITGTGNGPIASFFDALSTIGYDIRLLDYSVTP